MKTINIRPATRHDAKTVLDFICALAEYEKLSHQVVATEELLIETLFTSGTPNAAEVLLAFIADKPVGFALFFSNYSTFLGRPGIYLEDLFVTPTARGQGVGESLLRTIAAIAVERKAGRLEWSVLDWNQPAIDFYRRLGANPQSDWTTFRVDGETLQALGKNATNFES